VLNAPQRSIKAGIRLEAMPFILQATNAKVQSFQTGLSDQGFDFRRRPGRNHLHMKPIISRSLIGLLMGLELGVSVLPRVVHADSEHAPEKSWAGGAAEVLRLKAAPPSPQRKNKTIFGQTCGYSEDAVAEGCEKTNEGAARALLSTIPNAQATPMLPPLKYQ
jgi:hypothetical protein